MFATYQRLNLHVSASPYDVVRAARKKLTKVARNTITYREQRHAFLREMLDHHHNARQLFRQWRF